MRRSFLVLVLFTVGIFCLVGRAQTRQRLNPMIDLLEQKKPVFGVCISTLRTSPLMLRSTRIMSAMES